MLGFFIRLVLVPLQRVWVDHDPLKPYRSHRYVAHTTPLQKTWSIPLTKSTEVEQKISNCIFLYHILFWSIFFFKCNSPFPPSSPSLHHIPPSRYGNVMSLASTWSTCQWLTSSTSPLFLCGLTTSCSTMTGSTVRRAASCSASSSTLIFMSASPSSAVYHWTGTWPWLIPCASPRFDESKQVRMGIFS